MYPDLQPLIRNLYFDSRIFDNLHNDIAYRSNVIVTSLSKLSYPCATEGCKNDIKYSISSAQIRINQIGFVCEPCKNDIDKMSCRTTAESIPKDNCNLELSIYLKVSGNNYFTFTGCENYNITSRNINTIILGWGQLY